MLALYLICMMMNLAQTYLFILSLIALLLLCYTYKRVYTLSFAMHVLGWASGSWRMWGKNRQENAF
jgi:hypothetical protein